MKHAFFKHKITAISSNRWFSFILRIILSSIFIAAAVAKFSHQQEFINIVNNYNILPYGLAELYGTVLPWLEITIGLMLIMGIFPRLASSIGVLLTISFMTASTYAIFHDAGNSNICCGCFGAVMPLSHTQSLFLNVLMLLTAILIIFSKNKAFTLLPFLRKSGLASKLTASFTLNRLSSSITIMLILAMFLPSPAITTADTTNTPDNYDSTPIVKATTEQENSVIEKEKPEFIYFYSETCHYCQQEKPIIDELESEYGEKIVFTRIDVGENPQLITEYEVTSYPAMFLITHEGGGIDDIYYRFDGFTDIEILKASLDELLQDENITGGDGSSTPSLGQTETQLGPLPMEEAQELAQGTFSQMSVSSSGEPGNGPSSSPALSADGRYVAFTSFANNLAPDDTNGYVDVFVHDRDADNDGIYDEAGAIATVRVSISSSGEEGNSVSGGLQGPPPAISADGRYVAFSSIATNLVSDDTNGQQDIFVHDRNTDNDGIYDEPGAIATIRVSVSSSGEQANSYSLTPAISADGRYVAFWSYATNLVTGDTNSQADVFVHDRDADGNGIYDEPGPGATATVRMNVTSTGQQVSGNVNELIFNCTSDLVITPDGRYVAFAYNDNGSQKLFPDDNNNQADVYIHDRDADENGVYDEPGAISNTRVDFFGALNTIWSQGPAISADGRFVTLQSWRGHGCNEIWVYDRQTATTTVASTSSEGWDGNQDSGPWSAISADGRLISFISKANNLVTGDSGNIDVFVRDLQTGTTRILTGGADGSCPQDGRVSISANGLYVAFDSYASNLVPLDTNGTLDVFVALQDYQAPVWPADSNLTVENVGETTLTLRWTAAQDSAGGGTYRIYQQTEEGWQLLTSVNWDTYTYIVTGLTADTPYTFRVEAVDLAGNESTDGPSLAVRTQGTQPATTQPGVTIQPGGLATLVWDPAAPDTGATGYRIYRATEDQAPVVVGTVDGIANNSFQDTGLAAETTYTYTVNAFDVMGREWPHTVPATVITPPLSVTYLSWRVPRGNNRLDALLGASLSIQLLGEPNRQGEVELAYQTWYADNGTLLSSPRSTQAVLALTEQPGSPGDYRGSFTVAAGIAELTSLTARLSDGAGHTASQTGTGLPLGVSSAMLVEVVAPPTDLLQGSRLVAWSNSAGGGALVAVQASGNFTLAGLVPAGDYSLRLISSEGRFLASQAGMAMFAGQEINLSFTPPLPASLRVRVVDPSGDGVVGTSVAFKDMASGRVLMVRPTGSDGWTPELRRFSGEQLLAMVSIDLPYRTGASQTLTLAAGENQCTISLERLTEGTLTGQATNPEGEPVPGVVVTASQTVDGRPFNQSATTGADGGYSLTLYAGEATVVAASPTPVYASTEPSIVSIPSGGSATLDLALDTLGPGIITPQVYTRYIGDDWHGPMAPSALYFPVDVTGVTMTYWTHLGGDQIHIRGALGDTAEVCVDGSRGNLPRECQTVTLDTQRNATAVFHLDETGARIKARVLDTTGRPWRGPSNSRLNVMLRVADDSGQWTNASYNTLAPSGPEYIEFGVTEPGRYQLQVEEYWWDPMTGAMRPGGYPQAIVEFNVGEKEIVDLGDIPLQGLQFVWNFSGQEGNGLTAIPEKASPGSVVTLRSIYRNTGLSVPNASLILDIPRGTALVPGSVTLNGQPVSDNLSGSILEVWVGNVAGGTSGVATCQVRLAADLERQNLVASARINYDSTFEGQTHTEEEVLGLATIRNGGVTLSAPARLISLSTTLSGRAPAASTVQAYEGNVLLGQVQASPGGFWRMDVTLPDTGNPQWHELRATVDTTSGAIESPKVLVFYDKYQPVLQEFCMEQPIHGRVCFTPSAGVALFPYVIGPQPLSFDLRFNRPNAVAEVEVSLAGPGGGQTSANLGSDGIYHAMILLPSFVRGPGDISVTWRRVITLEELQQPAPTEEELREQMPWPARDFTIISVYPSPSSSTGWIPDQAGSAVQPVAALPIDQVQESDTGSVIFSIPTDSTLTGNVTLTTRRLTYTPTAEEQAEVQATGIPIYHNSFSYSMTSEELQVQVSGYIPESVLETSGSQAALRYLTGTTMAVGSGHSNLTGASSGARALALPAAGAEKMVEISAEVLLHGEDVAWGVNDALGVAPFFNELTELLNHTSSECSPIKANMYRNLLNNLAWKWASAKTMSASLDILGLGLAPETFGLGTVAVFVVSKVIDATMEHRLEKDVENLRTEIASDADCKHEDEDNDDDGDGFNGNGGKPGNKGGGKVGHPSWIYDPSGYVYEAVPDNRLEGVTTTIVQQVNSDWVVWDATWFGQENPLDTDSQGLYAWDVPEGNWQVVYEKSGYETAYSAVLPVPPPHFDVNTGMLSLAAPTVSGAAAGGTGGFIDVTFDKYMLTSTLTGTTIVITVPGGDEVAGSVSAFSPVTSPDGVPLARVARFTPDIPLIMGGSYQVQVSQLVQSYAGQPMAADYVTTIIVQDTIAPTWPTGSSLTASNVGQTNLALSWTAATDDVEVTGYRVYQGTTLLGTVAGTVQTYAVSGLTPGTQYTFSVEAGDAAGNWSTTGPSLTQATSSPPSTTTPVPASGGGSAPTPTPAPTSTPTPVPTSTPATATTPMPASTPTPAPTPPPASAPATTPMPASTPAPTSTPTPALTPMPALTTPVAALPVEQTSTNWIVIGGIIAGVIVVGSVLFFLIRRIIWLRGGM